MTQFIRSIAVLLISACLMQGACAQAITGKGFLPDENGTNLDAPQASKAVQQKVAAGTVVKDCPECPEMVMIPSGTFLMGSPPDPEPDPFSNEKPKTTGEANEKPQHRVQIQSFAMGKFEVTQEQWYAVMGNNPSAHKGRTLPVEQVSWDDIQQFVTKFNQKTGKKYRLPSESEWEYAARAGTTTEWNFGKDVSKVGNYAWYPGNSGGNTQAVGQKLPNAFGLFDMDGNVDEWTQDCWHENYFGAPTDGSAWTTTCSDNRRVLRGGSLFFDPKHWRSANRGKYDPAIGTFMSGFRLARDL
jgi:formylglycine-generating enzyme required for sulfatase activity